MRFCSFSCSYQGYLSSVVAHCTHFIPLTVGLVIPSMFTTTLNLLCNSPPSAGIPFIRRTFWTEAENYRKQAIHPKLCAKPGYKFGKICALCVSAEQSLVGGTVGEDCCVGANHQSNQISLVSVLST